MIRIVYEEFQNIPSSHEIKNKIPDLVRQFKVRQIFNAIDISIAHSVTCFKESLLLFQHNPQNFRYLFLTVDEIWIDSQLSKTKEQSK